MPTALCDRMEHLHNLPELFPEIEGFSEVVDALRTGRSATVDGAWGSSAALTVTALARVASGPLLVVLAHPRDVEAWASDLGSFLGKSGSLVLFPAWEGFTGTFPSDEIAGQRLRVLEQLQEVDSGSSTGLIVLTTFQALIQPVPEVEQLRAGQRTLRVGDTLDMDELLAWLVQRGYRLAEAVEVPGEFSRRGGILDIYSLSAEAPLRFDLFGDQIESIRTFDVGTQRSLEAVAEARLLTLNFTEDPTVFPRGHLCDYLPSNSRTVLIEVEELTEQGKHYLERVPSKIGLFPVESVFQELLHFPSVKISALPSPTVEASCHLRVESVARFSGNVTQVRDELDALASQDQVLLACHNDAEIRRLTEVLSAGKLAQADRLRLVIGRIRAGFRLIRGDLSVVVLGGGELFHREEARQVLPRRQLESRAIDSFLDLSEGDLVVHVAHGIARYRGMKILEKDNRRADKTRTSSAQALRRRHTEEHLVLEFREGVKLYVPASQIELVQKYVGGGGEPELSRYGGSTWLSRKKRAEEAVLDLAAEMLQLQAQREAQPGTALPLDSDWQSEFEASFPYQETPDQLRSLTEIKADLQRPRPMDRLICGDVGYGKTELAIRAAFKMVDNGRQVAVLVPTTVLAEQHYRTFTKRLAEYPFNVEVLSRFRRAGVQKQILSRLEQGGVDIVIGTHRLLSADVAFKDLGLVIIDEEQRFGVDHKERLKQLRQQVDVLTLTATPIPRTLHLSLLGIRDISNLETPPIDRQSVETRIVRFDPELIRQAILRELNREGQVYFVHNRVHDIKTIANKLTSIVPEARIVIAHGQMAERELERAMLRFVNGDADILLATTIIESGLDIPNANTIFIHEADHYGLADLHQLRGRVGRSKQRAYAYLLLDGHRQVNPTAIKRLKAIEEFTHLGAGFKIALRDLEIRGAGNILGNQQSGHIAAVGYELYCQLLENAVRKLKQQPLRTPLEVVIDLPWTAFLPRDYVSGQRLRIEIYRRLTRVRGLERLEDFGRELLDRFGPLPTPVEWLMRHAEIRLRAAQWKINHIYLEAPAEGSSEPTYLVLKYRSARKIRELQKRDTWVRIVDENSAYRRVDVEELEPESLYQLVRTLLRIESSETGSLTEAAS